LEASDQFTTRKLYLPAKESPVSIGYEIGWTPEPVWIVLHPVLFTPGEESTVPIGYDVGWTQSRSGLFHLILCLLAVTLLAEEQLYVGKNADI
jgi:hypothetical protein